MPDATALIVDALPIDTSVTFNPAHLRPSSEGLPTELDDRPDTAVPTIWKVRLVEDEPEPQTRRVASRDDVEVPAPVEYVLRRIIAVGGFGEVWEATQLSLGRPIAVKKLRDELIDDMKGDERALRRLELAFRQEALTAASLEHPNILPVHDLGIDEKGHLLMAMKLVRGRPWDEIIAEDRRVLTVPEFLSKHLAVLLDVMNAVAFAHSRAIVHRDLKPSQVMVGEFGEVLLMDWGIAIQCEDGAADRLPIATPTRATASNPAGTVAYMAPEQTEETPAHIGPWTDVYLLGGILYELLTLRRPHPAPDRKAAFFQARLGEVDDPREAARGREVPPELAGIALRALQAEIHRRYPSVEAMLSDLRGYLSGASRQREAMALVQQVAASLHAPGGRDYRELGAALNLLDRAVVLWPQYTTAVALRQDLLAQYARAALERRDLHLARTHAERLAPSPDREDLLARIDAALEEQRLADERLRAAYDQATASRLRAEQLVTFLLEDLHASLKEVNRLDLLEKVSRQALDYFEASGGEGLTPEARHMRALALRNIGDVLRGRGELDRAAACHEQFRRAAEELAALDPGCDAWQVDLAEAHDRLGIIHYFQGRLDEAERWHGQGLEILERLHEKSPGDTAILNALGHALHQLGVVAWRRRDLARAEDLQSRSLAIFERLAAADPAAKDYRTNLGWNLGTMGNVLRDQSRLEEAIAVTERSVAVRRQLREDDPEDFSRLDDLCWSATNLALLTEYTGQFDRALALYDQALELRRRLVEGDPSNAQHQNMLTFILSSIGRVSYGMLRHDHAARHLEEAVAISGQLAEHDRTNARESGSHALNCGYLGQVLLALGREDEARALVEPSLAKARHALSLMPTNGVFQNAVVQNLMVRGMLARLDGDEPVARADLEEALALIDPADWRTSTGQGMGILGELLTLLGRREEAAPVWDEMRARHWIMPRFEQMARG